MQVKTVIDHKQDYLLINNKTNRQDSKYLENKIKSRVHSLQKLSLQHALGKS